MSARMAENWLNSTDVGVSSMRSLTRLEPKQQSEVKLDLRYLAPHASLSSRRQRPSFFKWRHGYSLDSGRKKLLANLLVISTHRTIACDARGGCNPEHSILGE
jgi:hypothetical protein